MDKILTDPDLFKDEERQEEQTIRKKNLKIKFLEQENSQLRQRSHDIEKTLQINKQIIGALIDATQNQDYKTCFDLFQSEIKNLLAQNERLHREKDQFHGQVLISEQIKEELQNREVETARMHEGSINDLKESIERKEYSLQLTEKRLKEYEFLLQEIAQYDDYVKSKLEELNINTEQTAEDKKISNVVFENKKLQLQLEVAKMEIDNLKQLLDAMGDLQQNMRADQSMSEIQILNQMLSKKKQQAPQNLKMQTQQLTNTDLPSVKLFKRLTTLKRENNDLERECQMLREKVEDLHFLNQKLDEALKFANEKIMKLENSKLFIAESTAEDGTEYTLMNQRPGDHMRVSFDATKFLAQATPDQVKSFKASLIEGKYDRIMDQNTLIFEVSEFQDDVKYQ